MALDLAELEEELKKDPKSRRFYDLAREYQKKGRLDDALELCERGLAFHPSQWQSRILLAQLYLAKGRLEDARQMAEKVLLPLPDNVPANHLAADIYRALGDNEKALRHFKIVELLEPGRTGVQDHIAELSAAPPAEPVAGPAAQESPAAAENTATALVGKAPLPSQTHEETGGEGGAMLLTSQEDESSLPASEDALTSEPLPHDAIAEQEPAPEPGADEADVDWGVDTAAFDRSILEEEKDTDAFDAILPQDDEVRPENDVALPAESEMQVKGMPAALEEEGVPGSDQDADLAESGRQPEDIGGMSTVTLAELYERQGYPEKAVEIYQRLLLREPDNQVIHDKIQDLIKRLAGEAPEGPPVHQEDVERALRRKRVSVLQDWLRRVREGSHV